MTIRRKFKSTQGKKQLTSILLTFALVAMSVTIIIPLTAPKVRGQVVHLESTAEEDGVSPFDIDGLVNGIVVWDPTEDHHIFTNYAVDAGYTLDIPAMDFTGNPDTSSEITFKTANTQMDVYGTLITHSDDIWMTKTLFWGEDLVDWRGIYFKPLSNGTITDCIIDNATYGVNLQTQLASMLNPHRPVTLLAPGITDTTFRDFVHYGLRTYYVEGATNIEGCTFEASRNSGTGLMVEGGDLNLINSIFFSHGNGKPSLRILNSYVNVEGCSIHGNYQPGNLVYIKDIPGGGSASNIIFSDCQFSDGEADTPLVRIEGATSLFDNCSFDTTHGESSMLAYEYVNGQIPAHLIIRNPTADGDPGFWDNSFDNSTMNATGNSSITLQWYMDVFVKDPDGYLIDNAPVWVNDTLGDPAEPPFKITDINGWARWFVVSELIQYNDSTTYYNPFNVTAEAFSMKGYVDPEPMMNMSKEINVTVPFNPIPNTPPNVTWLPTPVGVQYGLITIEYRLMDPNPGDDGNLSVEVEWSLDGMFWTPATQGGGDPVTGLYNDTIYIFIWDSDAIKNLHGIYNTTVYIKIIPYDREGSGTPSQTGPFTVDNVYPILFLPPIITGVTNTTATISWSADEACNATVRYGLNFTHTVADLTDEETGSVLTTDQSVTLTGLLPGRRYLFVVDSTDSMDHTTSSYPSWEPFFFDTEVHIQLYTGWNMISIPLNITDWDLALVLASIDGEWDTVWAYHAWDLNDPWKLNDTNNPTGSDLHEILPATGIWIHMLNNAVLIPNHEVPEKNDFAPALPLYEGWNFIGYPSALTRTVDDALSGIPYDVIETYDAATGQWFSYDGVTGDLTHMEMGRGYWIYMTELYLWSLPYAE